MLSVIDGDVENDAAKRIARKAILLAHVLFYRKHNLAADEAMVLNGN